MLYGYIFTVLVLSDFQDALMATEQAPNVYFETSMGTFECELYWQHAPRTCHNFASLADRGYYNGCLFHRIVPNFIIQTGDPTGTGRGGASIYGKNFDDEIHPDLRHTGAGILSMANSGPNTNGSQFFVTLAPTQFLDGIHTIFGRISAGLKTIEKIGKVETDNTERPTSDILIVNASTRPSIQ